MILHFRFFDADAFFEADAISWLFASFAANAADFAMIFRFSYCRCFRHARFRFQLRFSLHFLSSSCSATVISHRPPSPLLHASRYQAAHVSSVILIAGISEGFRYCC
jgi:hypothetical protein